MIHIPEQVVKMFNEKPMMYLATVDGDGMPNVVPMLMYWWFSDDTMVIGDLYMKATKANVQATGKACISACGKSGEAYKLKGTATYQTSGPAYDLANGELHKSKPERNFKGAVVFKVTSVYDATRGSEAGKLMAESRAG